MLLELSVENFAVIDAVRWQPVPGLNVLTGETGAGKSLIIDAIGTLLGGRAGDDLVRSGAPTARVEGVFTLDEGSPLETLLDELGCREEDHLILARDIGKSSRNFCRVNGRTVPLRLLRQIGQTLIDIHGQTDQVSLQESEHQLALLDRFAGVEELRQHVGEQVGQLHSLRRRMSDIDTDERERMRRIDLLNFQMQEIHDADLHPGEDRELEQESRVLSNVQKLKALAEDAYNSLHGSDMTQGSAVDQIGQAVTQLKELVELDESLRSLVGDTESALYQIEDACHTLRSYSTALEADPARLDHIQQRLDLIRNLKRKYGDTVEEILAYGEHAERELEEMGHREEDRESLEREIAALQKDLGPVVSQLSKERQDGAQRLADAVEAELAGLGMSHVGFKVEFGQRDRGEGVQASDGRDMLVGPTGIDQIQFLVSTNPGEPYKPLSRIASTGETSRLLLAIKAALSEADATPILVFDEIDIGVGGRSGEVIGKKLASLSKKHQVIAITHLPQVAVYGDAHYVVSKSVTQGHTQIAVKSVSGQTRLEEISAMIGSQSEPTWGSAQEFASRARSWKEAL
ncbi:MAG: DNA repair protein RecN [Chloroflexota bacterium]